MNMFPRIFSILVLGFLMEILDCLHFSKKLVDTETRGYPVQGVPNYFGKFKAPPPQISLKG